MGITTLQGKTGLRHYPETEPLPEDTTQLTLERLNGNLLLLLNRLAANGIIELEKEAYDKLAEFFTRHLLNFPEFILEGDLQEYEVLLSKIQVKRPEVLVRFIGSEMADLGRNDYFTLKLLERLNHAGLDYEILLSSHGCEFIAATECTPNELKKWNEAEFLKDPGACARSLVNLIGLVNVGTINHETVKDLTDRYYLPHLKLISYSFDKEEENSFSLYSHAPIGLNSIRALAAELEVEYLDHTSLALAHTIDRINFEFARQAIQKQSATPLLHQLFEKNLLGDVAQEGSQKVIKRPTHVGDYHIKYIHGYATADPKAHPEGPIFAVGDRLKKSAFNATQEASERQFVKHRPPPLNLHLNHAALASNDPRDLRWQKRFLNQEGPSFFNRNSRKNPPASLTIRKPPKL